MGAAADGGGAARMIRQCAGSVLFVCGENSLRSPMAEALAKHMFGDRLYVGSVGVRKREIDPMAVAVLAEIGIDVSQHRPQRLRDLMDTSFDVIVSLSPEAQHQAVELTRSSAAEVTYWPTMDPSAIEANRETLLAAYRELREALAARIREAFGDDDAC